MLKKTLIMKKYILFAAFVTGTIFWVSCKKKVTDEKTYDMNGKMRCSPICVMRRNGLRWKRVGTR